MSEHQEQVAFFDYCRVKANNDPRYSMVVAIPNAGKRPVWVGAKLKREGLSPGFPDIGCFVPVSTFGALFIELKIKGNRPTIEQREWISRLQHMGYAATVAYGATEAIRALEVYLKGQFEAI